MTRYDECIEMQKKELKDGDWYAIFDEETGDSSKGLGMPGCLKMFGMMGDTYRIEEERCIERDKYTRYEFRVFIIDKDGNVVGDDVGSCDTDEKPTWSRFNIRALAMTRAFQRAIKKAYYISNRLSTDITPTESVRPPQAAPQQDAPSAEPSGPECACDVRDMAEPKKRGDVHVCGKCGNTVPRAKRIQYMSAHAAAN